MAEDNESFGEIIETYKLGRTQEAYKLIKDYTPSIFFDDLLQSPFYYLYKFIADYYFIFSERELYIAKIEMEKK